MSVFSILLLLLIGYLCVKAIGSIWRDAFGGVGTYQSKKSKREDNFQNHTQQSQNSPKKPSRPIEKGEGEYVDFEDVT